MRTRRSFITENRLFVTGLALMAFNSFVFITPIIENNNFLSAKFLIPYISFVVYFIAVVVDNKRTTGRLFKFYNLSNNLLLLLMANQSAYALNLSLQVFDISVLWLIVFLVVLSIAMIGVGWRKRFTPDVVNHVSVAILTAGLLLQVYQSIYVIPLLPLAVVACWWFGISLHILIPFWFSAQIIHVLRKYIRESESYRRSMIVGAAIPLVFLMAFTIHWNGMEYQIREAYHEAVAPLATDDLPAWVKAGQQIDDHWMVQRILNTRQRNSWNWGWSRAGFWEEDNWYHDPLIVVASMMSSRSEANEDTRENIQNAMLTSRHKTEPRLWSGDKLETRDIVSNIQLFPAYRIAYTEKVFRIHHSGNRRQQEAIYSFYLPEGAVVTSGSLWVAGEERPAYLTTKSKAEEAYTTIVGRERRDPLLITWQEGNRISARIFPCTIEEDRQFKIGFTSPLRLEGEQLVYENIDFDGPEQGKAKETVRVLNEHGIQPKSKGIRLKNEGSYFEYNGSYDRDWEMRVAAPPLNVSPFTFNSRSFQLKPFVPHLEKVNWETVYLDVNEGWTKSEFKRIWNSVKDKKVYIADRGLIELSEENRSEVFYDAKALNYSLFPFQKISQAENAIVITKSSGPGPLMSDLGTCDFTKNMSAFFQKNNQPVKTINIGNEISPFIKSLNELRALQVYACSLEEAEDLLRKNTFPAFQEDERTIVLGSSGIKIQQLLNVDTENNAPDHLLRLFAYNDVMNDIGRNYFNKQFLEKELIGKAKEANIVTPVSSLVTLETQADYDRFDIKAPGENSLKNASINESGAVPEPHEWVLILICLAFSVVMYRRCY